MKSGGSQARSASVRRKPHAVHPPPATTILSSQRAFVYGLAFVTLVAGAVRFAALFNDLWLDEIWSLRSLEGVKSAAEIFTRLRTDNNHPLNSLFMFVVGPTAHEWTYRLFSWATGVGTVWVAGVLARRQFHDLHPDARAQDANQTGIVTAVLFAGSYFFIHYSSEARGYAPAVCFSLVALYAFLRAGAGSWSVWTAVYWGACLLGMISHLTAVQVLVGCVCWSVVGILESGRNWRQPARRAVQWHGVPCLALLVYYMLVVRHVVIGGGPQYSLVAVLSDLAAFTLGTPTDVGLTCALPLFLVAAAAAIRRVWAQDRRLAVLYLTAIAMSPLASLVQSQFVLLFPRYFIVSAALALLLVGYLVGSLAVASRAWRIACQLALVFFVVGGSIHTARLLHNGRGQYRAAIEYVLSQSATSSISVSSGSDFRNRMVIEHFASTLPSGRRINYQSNANMPPGGTQWLFLDVSHDGLSPSTEVSAAGHRFHLDRVFLSGELSGWDWWIYRQVY